MTIENIDSIISILDQTSPLVSETPPLPFAATVEAMEAWQDELPIINTPQACGTAIKVLHSLNATKLEAKLRYDLTEKFRPCPFKLLNSSENNFLLAKFPLTPKNRLLVSYSISFQKALASAYIKIISSAGFVADTSKVSTGNIPDYFSEETLTTIIHRAMQSLGLVLLKSAQTYQFPPKDSWEHINALYRLAKLIEQERLLIQDLEFKHKPETSIHSLFKQLHFFALSSPNRFNQREIKSIYRLLEETSNLISLSQRNVQNDKQAAFYVNLNEDKPAAHISKLSHTGSTTYFFHTEAFIKYICSNEVSKPPRATDIDLSNKSTHFPEHTIRRLFQNWNHSPSRQFPRTEDKRPVTIYPNLQNLLKKLLNTAKTEHDLIKPVEVKGFDIDQLELVPIDSNPITHHTRDIRSERIIEKMLKDSTQEDQDNSIWSTSANTKQAGEAHSFASEIANISTAGYQVNMQGEETSQVKAGDLVGISIAGGALEIAVIRRLSMLDNKRISMGVELISPSVQVAKILNKSDDIRSRYVLLLPEIPATQQAHSILSPAIINVPNNQLILSVDGNKQYYKIQKMIESNSAFTQYTLE